jgi:hypothetical protein
MKTTHLSGRNEATMPIVQDYIAMMTRANAANAAGKGDLARKLRGKAEATYESMTAAAQRQIGQVQS